MDKNEKKARELAARLVGKDQNQQPLINLLLEMAKWKELEFYKILIKIGKEIKNEDTFY